MIARFGKWNRNIYDHVELWSSLVKSSRSRQVNSVEIITEIALKVEIRIHKIEILKIHFEHLKNLKWQKWQKRQKLFYWGKNKCFGTDEKLNVKFSKESNSFKVIEQY